MSYFTVQKLDLFTKANEFTLFRKSFKRSQNGFTLIELIVVIGVMAILTTIAANIFTDVTRYNRDQQRMRDFSSVKQALEFYRSDNQSYPGPVTSDLSILVSSEYLPQIPLDPSLGLSYKYQAYDQSGTINCAIADKNCVSYILCAAKESNGTFNNPAGCSSLTCGTSNCGMGVQP